MATKTEELIHELQIELTRLLAVLNTLQTEVRDADLRAVRERIRHIESLLAVIDIPKVLTRVATLEEQVAELKKWRDERDRRNWQFWLGVGMVIFSLFVNLFVAPWKR
jgi:hypothetical protein